MPTEVWEFRIAHILSRARVSLGYPCAQLLPPPGSLPDQARIYHICFVLYSLLVDFIDITSCNSHNNLVMFMLSSHLVDEGNESQSG